MKNHRMLALGVFFLSAALLSSCAATATRISGTSMGHAIIKAPPEKVWDYMFTKSMVLNQSSGKVLLGWLPAIELWDIQGAHFGETYQYTFEVAGTKYYGQGMCPEYYSDRMSVDKLSGGIDGTFTWVAVPDDQGTKLIMSWEYALDLPRNSNTTKKEVTEDMDQKLNIALKVIKENSEKK